MARKKTPDKPESEADDYRYETLVRLADDVGEIARVLAPMKGVSMGKLMSDLLRPVLSKMLEEEMRRRLGKK